MDITHEDYDWLGVLDSLDDEHHALEAEAGPSAGVAETAAATIAATAAATTIATGKRPWQCPTFLADPPPSPSSVSNNNGKRDLEGISSGGESGRDDDPSAATATRPPVPPGPGPEDDPAARKRSREKQRRVDTNAQFAALADLVREIETTDLAEEARARALEEAGDRCGGGDSALLSALKPRTSIPAFNPSNRVDLISRTIAQLTQFRHIRRRRDQEVRDTKRQCCELRKQCEQLQRTVSVNLHRDDREYQFAFR